MQGRRAFVVVLDACGAGALADAADYGDAGTNTLAHVADAVGGLELPDRPAAEWYEPTPEHAAMAQRSADAWAALL